VTDCPREDNKQKSTVFVVSTSNSGISSHSSTSGLRAGPSASEGNERHVGPDDIRLSPKAGVRKESRKRKSKVSALLTDTPVEAQVESEVKARRKSAKSCGVIQRQPREVTEIQAVMKRLSKE
jgi:hypothetical protein